MNAAGPQRIIYVSRIPRTNEVSQCDIVIRHHSLDLVELGEMRCVSSLISATTISYRRLNADVKQSAIQRQRRAHRNTRSIEYNFAGLKPPSCLAILYSISVEIAVVCVRSRSFSDSSRENAAR